ncbi:MAG: hypothetical protein JWM12_1957 [Ilumatobacteraceae bacterium]|jgi:quercetin dioxygenase-like cupin family protein|nr:hypothetical protein [Ilumatobacteraceae bacterium]
MVAPQGDATAHRLDAEVLAAIAAGLAAADPASMLPPGSTRRWAPLAATEAYSAWVIAWPAGTGLGMHDHDGCAAAVQVVSGRLRERHAVCDRGVEVRWLEEGATTMLPPEHVHEVVNVGAVEAVSVHVYSPPLLDTAFRDDPEIDLHGRSSVAVPGMVPGRSRDDGSGTATWPSGSGKGLQSPVPGFNSRRRLQPLT